MEQDDLIDEEEEEEEADEEEEEEDLSEDPSQIVLNAVSSGAMR